MKFNIRIQILKKKPKFQCSNCKSIRYKIIRTHGSKSRGIKVCKRCGEIIK